MKRAVHVGLHRRRHRAARRARARASAFLSKPFTPDALAAKVREVLDAWPTGRRPAPPSPPAAAPAASAAAPRPLRMTRPSACWSPRSASTATTAASRSWRARCATRAWTSIYTGLHRTPEEVVAAAVQEDVDVLGVSILSGAHMTLFPRVLELMRERAAPTTSCSWRGGVIPDEDVDALKRHGRRRGDPAGHAARRDRRAHPRAGGGRRDLLIPLSRCACCRTRGVDLTSGRRATTRPTGPPARAEHWLPGDRVRGARRARRADPRQAAATRCATRGSGARSTGASGRRRASRPRPSKSLDDLARFPVVQKADLRAAQAARPPFGDYLCIEPAEVARIHGTSGTTGRPTVFGIGADDWGAIGEAHARILWGAGLRPGDTHADLLDLQPLPGLVGRAGGRRAARRHGVPVRRRRRRARRSAAVQWARDLRPAAFYGTPSYALHLAETARREGIDPARLGFRHPVLLRRARRGDPGHAGADRGDLRRHLRGHGQHGGDDAVDDQRRVPPPDRHALWQDVVYTAGLRSGDVPAPAVRRRGHAGLHAPRAHVAADDPAGVGRPRAVDGRARAPAGAPIRGCRRASTGASTTCSRARRERLSERDRGRAARASPASAASSA